MLPSRNLENQDVRLQRYHPSFTFLRQSPAYRRGLATTRKAAPMPPVKGSSPRRGHADTHTTLPSVPRTNYCVPTFYRCQAVLSFSFFLVQFSQALERQHFRICWNKWSENSDIASVLAFSWNNDNWLHFIYFKTTLFCFHIFSHAYSEVVRSSYTLK